LAVRKVWYHPRVIPWNDRQRNHVAQILERYPVTSNRCATAACGILPTAQDLEAAAHMLVVRPGGFAIYVQPKDLPVRWFHHVTVAVVEHCVDALTGADGHPRDTYLTEYFDHPDAHDVQPVEGDEWKVL
jgi:hypothetical protein